MTIEKTLESILKVLQEISANTNPKSGPDAPVKDNVVPFRPADPSKVNAATEKPAPKRLTLAEVGAALGDPAAQKIVDAQTAAAPAPAPNPTVTYADVAEAIKNLSINKGMDVALAALKSCGVQTIKGMDEAKLPEVFAAVQRAAQG